MRRRHVTTNVHSCSFLAYNNISSDSLQRRYLREQAGVSMEIVKRLVANVVWLLFIYMFWTPLNIIANNMDLILSLCLFYSFVQVTAIALG